MKKALFITSFNDPDSAAISMAQFGPMAKGCDLILSDQSTDEDCIGRYVDLCRQHGFRRITNENKGASAAKRRIIEIAQSEGYDFMHQISEDFELVPLGEESPATPNGQGYIIADAEALLFTEPSISFVHWTWVRNDGQTGYLWSKDRKAATNLTQRFYLKLAYMAGDVGLFNWPYSGRVADLVAIQAKALTINPMSEHHKKDNRDSNGEWAQAFVSVGHGVAFYAHPVRHRDRSKPEGSLP